MVFISLISVLILPTVSIVILTKDKGDLADFLAFALLVIASSIAIGVDMEVLAITIMAVPGLLAFMDNR